MVKQRDKKMPKYENNRQNAASQGQKPSEKAANVRNTASSGSLETAILARLGLLKEASAQAPAWQKRVAEIQKMAERRDKKEIEKLDKLRQHDPHVAVRMAAVRALGKLYLSVSPEGISVVSGNVALEPFLDSLADEAPEVQATTVQVLMSVVSALDPTWLPEFMLDELVEQLKQESTDRLVRISIIQLLSILGTDTIPEIMALLYDRDWQIRETAVLALASLHKLTLGKERTLELHRKLYGALYDKNPCVRKAAIIATHDWLPVEDLLKTLQTGSSTEQEQTARVLGEWDKPTPQILNTLLELAANKLATSSVRAAAIMALAQLAPSFNEGVISNVIIEKRLWQDPDEDIRCAADMLLDVLPSEHALPRETELATGTTDSSPGSGNIHHITNYQKKRNVSPPE
jgi:HEAT repeat protein